jgi:putative intracellular protease/amidase
LEPVHDPLIGFVQEGAAGKIVAAICHGPWVLSDAGLTRGKRATGWWSIKPDLENAGATFIDAASVASCCTPMNTVLWLNTGGDCPDTMPQAITVTDAQGRWCVYVPFRMDGKIVVPDMGDDRD